MALQRKHKFVQLTLLAIIIYPQFNQAEDDGTSVEGLCYRMDNKSKRQACECSSESVQALRIDCGFRDLKSADFHTEILPLYSESLDISWNKLDFVPSFASESLKWLNLMHNNVSTLMENIFVQLPKLRELYLSWNAIQLISLNSFAGLTYLQVLDLSHNNLKKINSNVFAPLISLDSLTLSWNRQLYQSEGIEELDFYSHHGINEKLKVLNMEKCGIANLHLPESAALVRLVLRSNRLEKIPNVLPQSIKQLDLSDNLIEVLVQNETDKLPRHLTELLIEDMSNLRTIDDNALARLSTLKKLSFQNCRRLKSLHEFAFGPLKSNSSITLESVNFRGASLRMFNATLWPIFNKLTELELNGVPLTCDCELVWMKKLTIETNGRCFRPSRLRGMRLSNARLSDFSCESWPRWVYGIIVLFLIIVCAAGIYIIVMGLRPHRGVTMRRKLGAGSPYARVTIEPNRSENNYY